MGKTFPEDLQKAVQRSYATFAAMRLHLTSSGSVLLKEALEKLPELREGYLDYLRSCDILLLDVDEAMQVIENMYKLHVKVQKPVIAPTPNESSSPNTLSSKFRPARYDDIIEIAEKSLQKELKRRYYFASLFLFAYGFQKGNRACGQIRWSNIKAVRGLGEGLVQIEIQDDLGKVIAIEGRLHINEQELKNYKWQDIFIAMLRKHFEVETGKKNSDGLLELGSYPGYMDKQIWRGSSQNYVNFLGEIWKSLNRPEGQRTSFGSLKNGGFLDKTLG